MRKINLDEIFIGWEPHQIQKCSQKLHLSLEADTFHTCSGSPLQSLAVQAGRHYVHAQVSLRHSQDTRVQVSFWQVVRTWS